MGSSIQSYQTYWYKDETFMSTAFKDYKEGANYYNLIIPRGMSTTYWISFRCITTNNNYCDFDLGYVSFGRVGACAMYFPLA